MIKKQFSQLKSAAVITLVTLPLLIFFNNCGERINSQMVDPSMSFSSTAVGGNTNPYVLQCLSSSDGSAVSASLRKLIGSGAGGSASGKLSSFDWDQSVDLLVTFDVECLIQTGFSDPILGYVDASAVGPDQRIAAFVVKKESVSNLQGFVRAALDSECIKSAEPNEEVKIAAVDPYYANQKYMESPTVNKFAIGATDSLFSQIQSYVTDPSYTANNHIVKVAVIDTGIDSTNPDLAPILAKDPTTNTYLGENTSGSGAATAFLTDSGWHGTHVSGLIAAKYDNGFGISGVAGRNVSLYPFKGSSNGSTFSIAALTNAIESASKYNVDIINMSVGTSTNSAALRDAINAAMAKNITFVVAAGNGDASGTGQVLNSNFQVYPAMYSSDSNGLLAVGSLDIVTKNISPFSNRSNIYVDLLAPGSNSSNNILQGILSTIPMSYNVGVLNYPGYNGSGPGIGSLIDKGNGTASVIQGTSMAAPIVTGALVNIIAMAKSRGKTLTPNQLKSWVRNVAGSGREPAFTNYSVNGNYLNLEKLFYSGPNTGADSNAKPDTCNSFYYSTAAS
ncbi:MAG: hypothetical protein K0R29_2760 [Pseudobdellovibrio sp.]|nr:hypothetical protein [Pseudobdellovibrio sp.]